MSPIAKFVPLVGQIQFYNQHKLLSDRVAACVYVDTAVIGLCHVAGSSIGCVSGAAGSYAA